MARRDLTHSLSPGLVLKERYRLERMLGHGGMASVWLARDERLERSVAVKVLSETLASDEAFVERFRREATLAARLGHPNLVRMFDFSARGPRPFLVMEYVEGVTLEESRPGDASIEPADLARDLLGALAHIHEAGIVHRDVKPSNLLIAPNGRMRLTDFGIAKPEDATRITQTGEVLGTLRYIAPEVLAGEQATPRSDLYSCGVVLRDHLGEEAPPDVGRLISKLTRPDPDERPASASEALAMLDSPPLGVFHDAPAPSPPTAELPAAPVPRRELRIRFDPRYLLAALAGVAAIALGVIVLGGGDEETPSGSAGPESLADTSPKSGVPTPSANPDPTRGAALNQEGYALLQQGSYDEAIPVLRRAVASFPEGTIQIDYAYALFNLGQALRLAGRPDEAIPVLKERAKFADQRDTVLAELALAKQEAAAE